MSITGDFGGLQRLQEMLASLRDACPRTAEIAAPQIQEAMRAELQPGMGNGWAPTLTATPAEGGINIDAGERYRLPDGIPTPDSITTIVSTSVERAISETVQ